MPLHQSQFFLCSLLAIYHLIGSEPTVNFGSQRNLEICWLHAECVISKSNVNLCSARRFVCRYFLYNFVVVGFSFQRSASLYDNPVKTTRFP